MSLSEERRQPLNLSSPSELNQSFFDTRLHGSVNSLRGPHLQPSEMNYESIKDMNSLISLLHHSRIKQDHILNLHL